MAYNVLYNSKKMIKSINLIKQQKPDIVCLTELTPRFVRKFNRDRYLRQNYQYQALYPKHGTWGVGIVSKYPIIKKALYPLRPHRMPGSSAIIQINRRKLMIACVHLFPPFGKHRKSDGLLLTVAKNTLLRINQTKTLWKKFKYWRGSLILMGDMNEGRNDRALVFLRNKNYVLACLQVKHTSCGPTFPGATSMLPAVVEIDHILGRGVRFISAKVIKGGGSDHYPVSAVFQIDLKETVKKD